jgi:hypothetical protein
LYRSSGRLTSPINKKTQQIVFLEAATPKGQRPAG